MSAPTAGLKNADGQFWQLIRSVSTLSKMETTSVSATQNTIVIRRPFTPSMRGRRPINPTPATKRPSQIWADNSFECQGKASKRSCAQRLDGRRRTHPALNFFEARRCSHRRTSRIRPSRTCSADGSQHLRPIRLAARAFVLSSFAGHRRGEQRLVQRTCRRWLPGSVSQPAIISIDGWQPVDLSSAPLTQRPCRPTDPTCLVARFVRSASPLIDVGADRRDCR